LKIKICLYHFPTGFIEAKRFGYCFEELDVVPRMARWQPLKDLPTSEERT
jgi:hypothetical protein